MAAFVCGIVLADGEVEVAKGWRIRVGGQANFKVKGDLTLRSDAVDLPIGRSASSKSGARAAAKNIQVGSGRTDFENGAYIDSADSAGIAGETWNWHVPSGAMEDGRMSFSSGYSESSSSYEAFGGSASDKADLYGFAVGVDRDLWRKDKFGIGLGLDFAFFLKDDWFGGSAGGYTRTDTQKSGSYVTDVDLGNGEVLGDPWAVNADGSYGAGSFDGPGPVLNLSEVSVSSRPGGETSSSKRRVFGPYRLTGDLDVYEFSLAAKPSYDVAEWFSVYGVLGMGAAYRDLDVTVDGIGSESFDDWDVYMVCGAGALFRVKAFCLGFDYIWKVFDDDMDFSGRFVNGSVGDSGRSFRAYVGVEF